MVVPTSLDKTIRVFDKRKKKARNEDYEESCGILQRHEIHDLSVAKIRFAHGFGKPPRVRGIWSFYIMRFCVQLEGFKDTIRSVAELRRLIIISAF